jgi:hypothetical protein
MIFLKRFKRYIVNIDDNNCVNQINKQNIGYGSGVVEDDDNDNFYHLYAKIYERTIHIGLYIRIRNKHTEPIFVAVINIDFSKNASGVFTNCEYYIDDVLQQSRIPAKKIGNIDMAKLLNMVKRHRELFLSYRF